MPYKVFVSHGWHDRWIARQIASAIRSETKSEVFVDIFDVKSGDRIEQKVHEGLTECDELISLLTPLVGGPQLGLERDGRAGAWALRKRYVGIMYGVSLDTIDKDHGGLAILSPTNVITIDDLDGYLRELSVRVKGARHAKR